MGLFLSLVGFVLWARVSHMVAKDHAVGCLNWDCCFRACTETFKKSSKPCKSQQELYLSVSKIRGLVYASYEEGS